MTANIFCLSLFGRPFGMLGSILAVFLSVCGVQNATGAERPHAGCALSLTEARFQVKAMPRFERQFPDLRVETFSRRRTAHRELI
jgi:hypothetical protein